MMTHKYSKLILALLMVSLIIGCASQQPMSNYARGGDTISISLGGTDTNAKVPVLKKENISVTITDFANNTYPVTIRYVFKTYADPASLYMVNPGLGGVSEWETYWPAYQGQWMAVIDLSNPVTGNPLVLAAGAATISVTSPEIEPAIYSDGVAVGTASPGNHFTYTNGDLSSIPIEILPGTGSPNLLNFMSPIGFDPMVHLEPLPQLEVNVSGTPSAEIGGGIFVFQYNKADVESGIAQGGVTPLRVVPATPDPNVQLSSNTIDQGDGTALLKVMIMNPNGFRTNSLRDNELVMLGKSLLRSLRFNLTWKNQTVITDANWQNSIQIVSGEYVDVNGNPMAELTPVVTKVR